MPVVMRSASDPPGRPRTVKIRLRRPLEHIDLTKPYLVPVLSKPTPTVDAMGRRIFEECPLCKTHHACKVVHLWLEPDHSVLVSAGVLDELREGGAYPDDFEIVGGGWDPPTLSLNQTRMLQDQTNRAIRPLTPMRPKGSR